MRPSSSSAAALNDDSKLSGHPKEEISGLSTREFGEQISPPLLRLQFIFWIFFGARNDTARAKELGVALHGKPALPKELSRPVRRPTRVSWPATRREAVCGTESLCQCRHHVRPASVARTARDPHQEPPIAPAGNHGVHDAYRGGLSR